MKAIVTYMDLIGIGAHLKDGRAEEGVRLMGELHKCVYGAGSNYMPRHQHLYSWNDSVLLFAEISGSADVEPVLKEANGLKRRIDRFCPSYAISMQACTFPEPLPFAGYTFVGGDLSQPKTVFLRPSSIAFANCFIVEKVLGKKHKKPWYIEKRLADLLVTDQSHQEDTAVGFPNDTPIDVTIYAGDLWNEDLQPDI